MRGKNDAYTLNSYDLLVLMVVVPPVDAQDDADCTGAAATVLQRFLERYIDMFFKGSEQNGCPPDVFEKKS
jgi:hypothetical protein